MIKIEIKKYTDKEYVETASYPTEEIPTDKIKSTTYGETNYVMHKKYEVRDVKKISTTETILLQQNVEDDNFDLATVIIAINQLDC